MKSTSIAIMHGDRHCDADGTVHWEPDPLLTQRALITGGGLDREEIIKAVHFALDRMEKDISFNTGVNNDQD